VPGNRALNTELSSSRAKANLLRFWATGILEEKDFESAEFKKLLDLCVNCKACSLQCPSGVDISKIMVAARAEYAKRKGLGRTNLALSNNKYISVMASLFSPISNFFISLSLTKWFTEKTIGLDRRRKMPTFLRSSFLKKGRKYLSSQPVIKEPIDKVAYFVDSFTNFNDHELGFAVIKLLRHNNIEVILPKQRPAPLPAIVYGDIKTARNDLVYNVKFLANAIRDGYKIICSEPSAALCLKEDLRLFLNSDEAKLVSANTYELTNYLLGLLEDGKLKTLYHQPCHICAISPIDASVELLGRLCSGRVEKLNAGCCGIAGTFGMKKSGYDLSLKIAEKLTNTLKSSDCPDVLTECAACKMQIEHISDKSVTHPIKILAKAYGLL